MPLLTSIGEMLWREVTTFFLNQEIFTVSGFFIQDKLYTFPRFFCSTSVCFEMYLRKIIFVCRYFVFYGIGISDYYLSRYEHDSA